MNTIKLLIFNILIIFILSSFLIFAQNEKNKPLSVSLGIAKTELVSKAVKFAVEYTDKLNNLDTTLFDNHLIFFIKPNLQIITGEKDIFNGIVGKITGNLLLFDYDYARKPNGDIDTDSEGNEIEIPNFSELFHAFPISLGLESDRNFNKVSGVLEIGYIPVYQISAKKLNPNSILKKTLKNILVNSSISFYLQGGYKFATKNSNDTITQIQSNFDQSMEKVDNGLTRFKGSLEYTPKFGLTKNGFDLGLNCEANYWFDIINSVSYYRIECSLRMYFSSSIFFDFSYEKGSGEPNFNKGEQFSGNLKMAF